MNHMQHKRTSQRAQRKQAQLPHPAKSLQVPHVADIVEAAPHHAADKPVERDSALVRAASSLGASAAAGMVTAATFPAASIALPLGIAALGGAFVAMLSRHHAA